MANFKTKSRSERAGLPKRTTPVTPWDPSRRATARVPDPLPAPTTCRHCDSHVELVNNSEVYGREYGEWPWMYLCRGCGAHVGIHPFTNIPLGTLADEQEREARKRAKDIFNKLWRGNLELRGRAYDWLSVKLGIPRSECHFGMFSISRCEQAIYVMKDRKVTDPV